MLKEPFISTVSSSDENFDMCLECFDLFVTLNMKSWNKALSRNELPKPLNDIANELGDKCRPACGCKMISNERIGSISECKNISQSSRNINSRRLLPVAAHVDLASNKMTTTTTSKPKN